jgi:hypothetical protein
MDSVYRLRFFKKLIGGNGYARRAGVRAWSLRADRAVAEVLPRRKYVSGSGPERSQTTQQLRPG